MTPAAISVFGRRVIRDSLSEAIWKCEEYSHYVASPEYQTKAEMFRAVLDTQKARCFYLLQDLNGMAGEW